MILIKKIIAYFFNKINILGNILININNNQYCPVCSEKVLYFLPLPKQFRNKIFIKNQIFSFLNAETLNYKAYSCPKCSASDRERFYALFIHKYVLPSSNIDDIKIIHFAPENALKKFMEKYSFKLYRTADLFMKNVDDQVDLTKLNIYSEDYFDFFICSHMLEHIPDDKKAISELFRILKPKGRGILMVPILLGLEKTYEDFSIVSNKDRLRHFGQEDHVRAYSKYDYINLLSNAGFTVIEFTAKDFTREKFQSVGIDQKAILYIVEKNA